MFGHKDLISRVKLTCKKYGIFLLKYIFDDSYSRVVRNNFTKGCAVQDGLTDSVRLLLGNNNPQNRILLNLMLRAFKYLQILCSIHCTFVCFLLLKTNKIK